MFNFIRSFFQQLKFKAMARQLRKPAGAVGSKVGQMMNKANQFLYDATLSEMKIKNNEAILEIGFGNGLFFEKIFQQGTGIKISGIDYSAIMVKEATANNQAFITTKQLTLVQGSSDQLPFADNSFDKIFCINVIYFWDKPHAHLQEIKRVLKPGGIFYATLRTKESMEQMPFTRYNFIMYTKKEWVELLAQNQLELLITKQFAEPEVMFEGKPFQIHSHCIAAKKPTH